MSVSITDRATLFANMYTPVRTQTSSKTQSTNETILYSDSASDTNKNDNSIVAKSAVSALPDEKLKAENCITTCFYGNGCFAEVYMDDNFSEENPLVNVYTTDPTTNEWKKTTVNLNDLDKSNMSPTEVLGASTALEKLGKITSGEAVLMSNSFMEMYEDNAYTYDDLFKQYDAKSIFAKQMQTQYDCGNMQGYLNHKHIYDVFFND